MRLKRGKSLIPRFPLPATRRELTLISNPDLDDDPYGESTVTGYSFDRL